MRDAVRHAYPLLLDVTDRLVVIVGGGPVAVRKAQGLIAAGARRVRCVAPEFHPEMPPDVERRAEAFAAVHLDGAALVFAATNRPEVNEAVVREAHRRGLLVNRADADDEQPGDFITPAVWRDEAVMLTVSAAGSPALAATIRDDLGNKVDAQHRAMAVAMQSLRPMIRQAEALSAPRRRQIFRDLATPQAMQALAQGALAGLRQWLAEKYPELTKMMKHE